MVFCKTFGYFLVSFGSVLEELLDIASESQQGRYCMLKTFQVTMSTFKKFNAQLENSSFLRLSTATTPSPLQLPARPLTSAESPTPSRSPWRLTLTKCIDGSCFLKIMALERLLTSNVKKLHMSNWMRKSKFKFVP